MLKTPGSRSHVVALDIFSVSLRPCRAAQEKIVDYYNDGRPQFEWEYLRQAFMFKGNPRAPEVCESCPLNVFGDLEGCSGTMEAFDIFMRAIAELAPDSPWNDIPLNGTPVTADQMRELNIALGALRTQLSQREWPVAQPRYHGEPIREPYEDGSARLQFYAWNGEGPPGLIAHNSGYQTYLSKHGLIVKATYEDPVPHTFRKLWREGRGTFGLSATGETVGFEMSMARYPTWGFEETPGSEIAVETMPADQAFGEILVVLEVFSGIATDYDTGILIHPVA